MRLVKSSLLTSILCIVPSLALAQTAVPSGNLVGSQTWTAAGSPYRVQGDLTVPVGLTLTLEAGTVVHLGTGDDQAANLDTNRTELRIAGALTVNGTTMSPVIVRSSAASPATGDFYGVVLLAGANANAANLRVERGYRCIYNSATGTTFTDLALHDCNRAFEAVGGASTITRGEVLRSTSYGIYSRGGATFNASGLRVSGGSSRGISATDTTLVLADSLVANNSSYGIYLSGSQLHNSSIEHTTVYGNNSYGMYFSGNSNNRVIARNNIVAANRTYGVYRSSSPQVTASYNLVWNNGTNYSGVSAGTGAITENPLLADAANDDYRLTSRSGGRSAASDGTDIGAFDYDTVPTPGLLGHLFVNTVLTAAASPHIVLGDLTVELGVSLTIEPGAELRFTAGADQMDSGDDANRSELRVQGTLLANGTPANGILLTSSGTGRGDWYGLRLLSTAANSSVDYTTIQYARYGIRSSAPSTNVVRRTEIQQSSSYGIYADSGSITFDQMDVHDNSSRGLSFTGASGGLTNSQVYDNSSYGLYATSGGQVAQLLVENNTIVDNNSYGTYFTGNSNSRVTIRNNIIVSNRTYGVYRSSSPQVTASYNLVWSNGTNYSGVSAGMGAITENPLFVDQANEDFRITSNSPARMHASNGADLGALTHDGIQTPALLGHLYTDRLLTAANSPHIVPGDLTIEPGVTLTIEPGCELRFAAGADQMSGGADTARTELRVLGTLVADGTTSTRLTFTSNATTKARGDWYGVHLLAGSTASIIDLSTIEYARYGVRSSAPAGTTVQRTIIQQNSSYGFYGEGGGTALSQVTVRDNSSRGISLTGFAGSVSDSLVYDNSSYGIYATSGSSVSQLSLTGNTIADNNSYGLYFTGNSNNRIIVQDNIVVGNRTYGIYRSSSPQITASYNLVWNNGTNYSGVSGGTGALAENPLFVDSANSDYRITSRSPARMHAQDGSDLGGLVFDGAPTVGEQGHIYIDTTWTMVAPIQVLGDITVEPGVTLTINAGTQVRFAASTDSMQANFDVGRTELIVLGRLQVNGTAGSRVSMRSAAASPARGDWYGVHLRSTAANSSLRFAHIEFARYGVRSSAPSSASVTRTEVEQSLTYGVWVDGGAVVLDGLHVHDNSSRGITVQGAAPVLRNLVVTDNSSYGIYATSGSSITQLNMDHLTVDGNNSYGVYLTGNSNLRVNLRNSTITNNRTYGVYRSSSPQVALGRNNVWTNGTNYSGVSAGAMSLSANPQFVSPALENYRLLPNSTLIDAADPATALLSDFDGTTRPLDGDSNMSNLPDLGAFEFNPSNNQWPIADSGPDRVATSGLSIQFDASGSVDPDGTISTYVWDFGDGDTATGITASHTFTGGTDRTVTLTVTDNAGATDVDTTFVEVNLPPTAEAGPPRFGDPGEIISHNGASSTDSDGSVVTYAWNYGDGTFGSGQSVTHSYSSSGQYTVTLTVTDDDGASGSDTTTVNITGTDSVPPVIALTPVQSGQTAGQSVSVSANVTDTSGVNSASLYYRTIGTTVFTLASMSNTSGATYTGTVPGTAVAAPGVEYYVSAIDSAMPANSARQPSTAPSAYFTFTVSAPAAPTMTHTPVSNGQPQGSAITLTADVNAAAGIASVTLYYRATGSGMFMSVSMANTTGSTYQGQIPGTAATPPGLDYYLEVTDSAQQSATTPPGTGAVHAFTITASDTSAPTISHTPITGGQAAGQAVLVLADATDASGVQSVTLYYRVSGGGMFATLAMSAAGSSYSASIPGASVTSAGVDYYIGATDQASPANTGTNPVGAPGNFLSFTAMRVFNVSVGDIVVTEIMADPSGTENQREWFELYNTTGRTIDIDGFTFSDDGVDAFTVNNSGPLNISSSSYIVLARNGDSAVNGGVTVDYVYAGMALSNTIDEVIVSAGGLVIDRVAYDGGMSYPRAPGYSLSLDPLLLNATGNDTGGNWCLPTSQLAGGDFGTPALPNDSCLDITPPQVVHTPIQDGQQADITIAVNAVVTDDTAVGAVQLLYRVRGAGAFTSAPMSAIGADVYQGELPASAVTVAGVQYYIRVLDSAMPPNETIEPSAAPGTPHEFDVTTNDSSGPSITHNPIADGQAAEAVVEIIASIADSSGVQEALLHYRAPGGAWQEVTLADIGQDVFLVEIPSVAVTEAGLEYYLSAIDTIGNGSSLPEAGETSPYTFTVVVSDEAAPVITHSPIADGQATAEAVLVQASVNDASRLAEVRLYFRTSGEATFISTPMSASSGVSYTAEIPGALVTGAGVDYYIEAVDSSPDQNTGRDPMDAPTSVHSFTVEAQGEDIKGPNILHIPVVDGQAAAVAVLIVAEIADDSGVSSATVRFRSLGGTEFSEVSLTRVSGDRFEADLPAESMVAPGLEYYIEATDSAPQPNVAVRPVEAPQVLFTFTVKVGDAPDPGGSREDSGCTCTANHDSSLMAWGLFGLFGLVVIRRRKGLALR